jgi:sporulation protein YlmC with PRC-barrel domain
MAISVGSGLVGRTVLDGRGQIVGTVEDALVEEGTWGLAALRVKLRRHVARDIGASPGLLHAAIIDVPARMVHGIGDAVILSVPAAALHESGAESADDAAAAAGQGDGRAARD